MLSQRSRARRLIPTDIVIAGPSNSLYRNIYPLTTQTRWDLLIFPFESIILNQVR